MEYKKPFGPIQKSWADPIIEPDPLQVAVRELEKQRMDKKLSLEKKYQEEAAKRRAKIQEKDQKKSDLQYFVEDTLLSAFLLLLPVPVMLLIWCLIAFGILIF